MCALFRSSGEETPHRRPRGNVHAPARLWCQISPNTGFPSNRAFPATSDQTDKRGGGKKKKKKRGERGEKKKKRGEREERKVGGAGKRRAFPRVLLSSVLRLSTIRRARVMSPPRFRNRCDWTPPARPPTPPTTPPTALPQRRRAAHSRAVVVLVVVAVRRACRALWRCACRSSPSRCRPSSPPSRSAPRPP